MMRKAIMIFVLLAGVTQASGKDIETQHLIVSDATGKISDRELKSLADDAQTLLGRILTFWSAEPGLERFGKIRVIFDLPRRDVYSSVFFWEEKDGKRTRVVQVFRSEGAPQMMAHKLTSAVFPQKDKLIRNIMGILTEAQIGNALTFPMCGFCSDEWVLALLDKKAYIPLDQLGPDHESWGMKDNGNGKLAILDKAKQHAAYAEAGSFSDYLFHTYGIKKIKLLQRLSQEKNRPWQEAFGAGLQELEANWLQGLQLKQENETVKRLLQDSDTACAEAQKLSINKKQTEK